MTYEDVLDDEHAGRRGTKPYIDFELTVEELQKGDIITAKIFTFDQKAQFYKARLQSEGIKCFLTNENTASILSGYSIGLGGIELKILQRDREAALNIINLLDHRDLPHDEESYQTLLEAQADDKTFNLVMVAVLALIFLTLAWYLMVIYNDSQL